MGGRYDSKIHIAVRIFSLIYFNFRNKGILYIQGDSCPHFHSCIKAVVHNFLTTYNQFHQQQPIVNVYFLTCTSTFLENQYSQFQKKNNNITRFSLTCWLRGALLQNSEPSVAWDVRPSTGHGVVKCQIFIVYTYTCTSPHPLKGLYSFKLVYLIHS